MSDNDLIFDIGLHTGEDTEFYLKKGYRVIAVDANPDMCKLCADKFLEAVERGRLVIRNVAISRERGQVTFYKNEVSEWGTIDPLWAERNVRKGHPSTEQIQIEAVTAADLIAEYGQPLYCKIDIEGLDLVALKSLGASELKPKYVSIESDKVSFSGLREEFATLQSLGYSSFKIVQQHRVTAQPKHSLARDGSEIEHLFKPGASGMFGEEAPGEWLTAEEAIERYKGIFLKYHLVGDDPLVTNRLMRALLWRAVGFPGWHDTHARLQKPR